MRSYRTATRSPCWLRLCSASRCCARRRLDCRWHRLPPSGTRCAADGGSERVTTRKERTTTMTTVNAVTTPPTAGAVGDSGMSNLSPDAMLDYCQIQLSGLDTQIDGDIKQQETQLREREAVQSAQTALEQFGTTGPQNYAQFQ